MTGAWKLKASNISLYECSECGCDFATNDERVPNKCPECGAEMCGKSVEFGPFTIGKEKS